MVCHLLLRKSPSCPKGEAVALCDSLYALVDFVVVCLSQELEQVHDWTAKVVEDNGFCRSVKPYRSRAAEQVNEDICGTQERLNLRHEATLVALVGDWSLVNHLEEFLSEGSILNDGGYNFVVEFDRAVLFALYLASDLPKFCVFVAKAKLCEGL